MKRTQRPVVLQPRHALSARDVKLLDQMGQKGYTNIEVIAGRGPDGGRIRNVGAALLQTARRLERMGLARVGSPSCSHVRGRGRYGGTNNAIFSVEMTPAGKAAWYAHYGADAP